jgi:hypothetical protein
VNVAYVLGGLVLAAIIVNGVWMLISSRTPIGRLDRRMSKAPAAKRWAGAARSSGEPG